MADTDLAAFFGRFDRVRVISLASRADRRRQVTREFAGMGVALDGARVALHDAVRPDDAGGFETVGARGCFLSHLGVLREARAADVGSVLILEDDVTFARAGADLRRVADALGTAAWNVFYGGYDLTEAAPERGASPLRIARADEGFRTTHCLAFDRAAITAAVPYLEAILARPAGSPEGGPMHVDGAYCWLRRAHPDLRTAVADPAVAHQRASRTDIHRLRVWDRILGLRHAVNAVRAMRG